MPDLNVVYKDVREHSVNLCKPLQIEDYVPQPVAYVSPTKWHLAHTTWFFEEFILKPHDKKYLPYNKDYGFLFNSYYNTVGKRVIRADRGNLTRPSVSEIYDYREFVDKHMQLLFSKLSSNANDLKALIVLGLNHEQQHQELLITDLKYVLGHNPLFPVYDNDFSLVNGKNSTQDVIHVEAGVYDIGYEGNGFYYDNELGRHKVYLEAFEIDEALITNEEYLEFINDGGYQRFELWLDEGWAWVNSNNVVSPLYWHKIDGHWHQYTLSGLLEVEPDAILAHINYYEASAFAQWRGKRLPTEFEWEVASDQLSWGERWEWTNSAYSAYPGFKTAEGAIGEYNGKFMVNQMVLRGASKATSPNHSRKTYRNFFHPEYQWQLSGIRLAK